MALLLCRDTKVANDLHEAFPAGINWSNERYAVLYRKATDVVWVAPSEAATDERQPHPASPSLRSMPCSLGTPASHSVHRGSGVSVLRLPAESGRASDRLF